MPESLQTFHRRKSGSGPRGAGVLRNESAGEMKAAFDRIGRPASRPARAAVSDFAPLSYFLDTEKQYFRSSFDFTQAGVE